MWERICKPGCERRKIGCQSSCPDYCDREMTRERRERDKRNSRIIHDYGGELAAKIIRHRRHHGK